jgi:hypothetical protein
MRLEAWVVGFTTGSRAEVPGKKENLWQGILIIIIITFNRGGVGYLCSRVKNEHYEARQRLLSPMTVSHAQSGRKTSHQTVVGALKAFCHFVLPPQRRRPANGSLMHEMLDGIWKSCLDIMWARYAVNIQHCEESSSSVSTAVACGYVW